MYNVLSRPRLSVYGAQAEKILHNSNKENLRIHKGSRYLLVEEEKHVLAKQHKGPFSFTGNRSTEKRERRVLKGLCDRENKASIIGATGQKIKELLDNPQRNIYDLIDST